MKTPKSKEKLTELRPDKRLLDPTFESYKLSLEEIPSIMTEFRCGVALVAPDAGLFSYAKTRCLSMHNHLTVDVWHASNCFFFDATMKIRRFHVHNNNRLDPAQFVYKMDAGCEIKEKERLPPTLSFPSRLLCVASDGRGSLHVIDTGDRRARECAKWSRVYADDTSPPCVILDTHILDETLHLLVARFEERSIDGKEKCEETVVVLEWIELGKNVASGYVVTGSRTFEGKSYPDYAAITKDGLSIAANTRFVYKSDWNEEVDMEAETVNDKKTDFKWKQTNEDVTMMFDVGAHITAKCVVCDISRKRISIAVRSGSEEDAAPLELLVGELYLDADPAASTWSVEDGGQLHVCVQKREEGRTWPQLLDGEDCGEFVCTAEEAERVHSQLEHLTSDKIDVNDQDNALYNGGELEDCDAHYESGARLWHFSSSADAFTHANDTSALRWLFNAKLGADEPDALVLRHDVDAIVWQPDSDQCRHMSTFNALGYVHASKTNIKFGASPPDSSYAALCECQRRIYVYRQPSPLVDSTLKNRALGKRIAKISKQQVATINSVASIEGMQATNSHLFVLTAAELYVFRMACDVGA